MTPSPPLRELAVTDQSPRERGDAARNRALLLDVARRLIAERGPEAVTTDDIAAAAGVGKGTLFRRFGSRAGLMLVLLDKDEKVEQEAMMFGPPPLGPGSPPLERLLAYGRHRLEFVHVHHALLSDAGRDPQMRFIAPVMFHHRHIRVLLEAAQYVSAPDVREYVSAPHVREYVSAPHVREYVSAPHVRDAAGNLDAQAYALLSLLDADYVQFQLTERGQTLGQLGDAWESVARKLCAA
ncbi:MAG: TetR/AcrR family transcriptional regulator [Mycobacterium sp.]